MASARTGVANMRKKKIQWFVKADDVYSIRQDPEAPSKFVLTFLHHYSFEAATTEQAARVVDTLQGLGLGQHHFKAEGSESASPISPSSPPSLNAYLPHSSSAGGGSGAGARSCSSSPSSPIRCSPTASPSHSSPSSPSSSYRQLQHSLSASTLSTISPISHPTTTTTSNISDSIPIPHSPARAGPCKIESDIEDKRGRTDDYPINPRPTRGTAGAGAKLTIGLSPLTPMSPHLMDDTRFFYANGKDLPTTPIPSSSSLSSTTTLSSSIPSSSLSATSSYTKFPRQRLADSTEYEGDEGDEEEKRERESEKEREKEGAEYDEEEEESSRLMRLAGDSRVAQTLEQFELVRVLGKGSFGKVLLAIKKDSGQKYALKILKKSELYKRNQIDHTNTEKNVLSMMDHPFIVKLHYSFQNDEKLYMCLDYVEGGELFIHLRRLGMFSQEYARFYIAEVIMAIEHMHKHDTIYRDLKPENILLDKEGHIKLTDFGLSKMGITSVGGKGDGQTAKTFCGTPEYLAPEILTGIGHGKAVDWWSVGILIYEMLTGKPPFYSKNRNTMYLNTIKGTIECPNWISSEAESLLKALLVRRPEDRPTVEAIKAHPFFKEFDWEACERKEITPPFIPNTEEEELGMLMRLDPSLLVEKAESQGLSVSPLSLHASSFFKDFAWSKEDERHL